MKASVRYRYGSPDVLRVEEVDKPSPKDDELLIKVHAASANLGDWELLRAQPFFLVLFAKALGPKPRVDPVPPKDSAGLFTPKYKILGCDIAGRVEAVGAKVTQFRPGDEVFGMCGLGAFAEYVVVPAEGSVVKKPASLSFEEAAALPQAAFIALQGIIDKGQVRAGQKVLITGAGGGAGTLAVQLAKSRGAEVTGVDNGKKLELMRSIGADYVIDYTREDFRENGERYDFIFDLAAHRSVFAGMRSLKPGGLYLVAGGAAGPTLLSMLFGSWVSRFGSKTLSFLMADTVPQDLVMMTEMIEAGEVKPVIDKRYPLSELPEALRYMGEGQALGKVVITIG